MLTKIKQRVLGIGNSIITEHRSRSQAIYDRNNLSHYLKTGSSISSAEKREIENKWGRVISKISRGFEFFQGMKEIHGFNPDFLPSSYFFPYIEGALNPTKWKYLLSHKSMIELTYSIGVGHPNSVLRSYGGVLLDKDYKPVALKEAAAIIKKIDYPLLFKPASDSEQGAGIKLINANDLGSLCDDILSGEIFKGGTDFVLQEPVKQSNETSIFNPTSLNCMRITTLNLNGRVSVGSRAIKCGPKNSVVDNIGSGKRGVIVGIKDNGELEEKGFYGNGEATPSHNDIIFSQQRIDHFQRVVDAALALHEYTPMCKIIGWDIALDDNNNPVLIEGNTVYPGISFEQMCSGPIFGDRTDEVIRYLEQNLR